MPVSRVLSRRTPHDDAVLLRVIETNYLQVEARESAQGKLNASYRGDDLFSTRRVKLITDPAVENS